MKKLKSILVALFPFALTLVLWRINAPFWNPGGILAFIPIFFYSFVRPRPFFFPFALLITLAIDANMGTLIFWTFMLTAAYAIYGLQNFIDMARQKISGILFFMGFIGIGLSLLLLHALIVTGWSFLEIFESIWLMAWMSMWYFVFVKIVVTRNA